MLDPQRHRHRHQPQKQQQKHQQHQSELDSLREQLAISKASNEAFLVELEALRSIHGQEHESLRSENAILRKEQDTWIKEKQTLQHELQKTTDDSVSALAAKDSLYDELRVQFEQQTHSFQQEKQSLEHQTHSLSAQTLSLQTQLQTLQSTLLSAQSDRDFFHTQYTTASAYTTTVRAENLALQQRAETAEAQAAQGVAEVKAVYKERLRKAEEEGRVFSRIVDFMMKKDEATEGVRREAGEAPELRARCGELEGEVGRLEREREQREEERGRLEGEVERLEGKVGRLEREREEREGEWRREVGKIKQRIGIDVDMDGDVLIHYHDRDRDYIPGDPAAAATTPVAAGSAPGPAPAPGSGSHPGPAPAPGFGAPSSSSPDPNQKVFRCEWREHDGPCLFICETRKVCVCVASFCFSCFLQFLFTPSPSVSLFLLPSFPYFRFPLTPSLLPSSLTPSLPRSHLFSTCSYFHNPDHSLTHSFHPCIYSRN